MGKGMDGLSQLVLPRVVASCSTRGTPCPIIESMRLGLSARYTPSWA